MEEKGIRDNFLVWGPNTKRVGITIYSNLRKTIAFVSVFEFSEFDIALRYRSKDASIVRGTDTDYKCRCR